MFNYIEGGGASRKIVLLIFQPTHFIVFCYDECGQLWRKKQNNMFSTIRLHGNGGHLGF